MSGTLHGGEDVSPWIRRWSHLVPAGGTVLDLACGRGRHVRWFAGRGHPVVALDRSQEALDAMADLQAGAGGTRVQTVQADIENQPWPLMNGQAPQTFDAVVVTNYLWRATLPTIVGSVAPGGVLLYETFAHGNASVGKPSRPDFLLQPGELLRACQDLRVVAYEDGFLADPPRFVQRIAAVREPLPVQPRAGAEPAPTRYRL
ncbi:MAG: class I SAM-dependent methyltransferase [Rhodoferax sp.]|nr:class I SAM-dependent methyltransferase [Rhodoferax sp.]